LEPAQGRVNGFSTWLKSHVFCVIPEQLLEPVFPGQPPLSRWTAQIDRVLNALALASATEVLSVRRRFSQEGRET
jgi:hypothetical protein